MPTEILMPALSPTMTEGTLATWQKAEGDRVAAGDIIAEIETDKATMEMEAVDEGVLGRILVPAGSEHVAVNTPIALLLEEGEDAAALDETEARAPAAQTTAVFEPHAPSVPAAPIDLPTRIPSQTERIIASPLARRLAAQAGLDLAAIKGSGPRGRIVKADLEGATAAMPARTMAPAVALVPPAAGPDMEAGGFDTLPLNAMRKTIARRLTESKHDIPHFYVDVACRLDKLLALRSELNGRKGADYKLSVNDFVLKAVAVALKQVPACNAAWGGDHIRRFHDVDVAVAVAVPDGLLTPVVRRADRLGIVALSETVRRLADRARAGALQPEEYTGGGFAVSNLGMFGVERFSAIINPPQAAILAVGAANERAVVVDRAVTVATMMDVCLSVDHRIIDGALAGEWIQAFKAAVEDPLGLLL